MGANLTIAQRIVRAMQSKAKNASVDAAAAGAKVLYDAAKANVPVKSGTLKAAIYRTLSHDLSNDEQTAYQVSWNRKKAPHGHLVEFGTARAPAHPFLGKAKVEKSEEVVRLMRETFKKGMGGD